MGDLIYNIKEYFKFEESEVLHLLVTSLILGFILSFRKWGAESFDAAVGFSNLLFAVIIVLIILLLRVVAQKIVAISMGYTAKYSYWGNGLIIGLFVSFLTYGIVPFLAVGAVDVKHRERLRLGSWRYGLNIKDFAIAAVAGPIMSVLIVWIVRPFFHFTQNARLQEVMVISLLIGIFSMLPIPKYEGVKKMIGGTDGLHLFRFSHEWLIIGMTTLLVYGFFTLIVGSFPFILSMLIGLVVLLLYGRFVVDAS